MNSNSLDLKVAGQSFLAEGSLFMILFPLLWCFTEELFLTALSAVLDLNNLSFCALYRLCFNELFQSERIGLNGSRYHSCISQFSAIFSALRCETEFLFPPQNKYEKHFRTNAQQIKFI